MILKLKDTNVNVSNRAHTVFFTSKAPHVRIFRHTRFCWGRLNVTTVLEIFLKDFGDLSFTK